MKHSFRSKHILRKKSVPARKIQELKLAFSEFYLSLILLQNYQNLNFTGFRKILKKHDKLLSQDEGAKFRTEQVEQSHFYTNKDIDRLIQETESLVTQDIEHGDRQKAMKRLRVPPLGEQQSPYTTFKVGLFSGAFVVLLGAVVLSSVFYGDDVNFRVALRLYRGPLLVIEFLFLWGINVYGWRSAGVNHVLIFELDPRNHLSEQHIIELASIFGVIWSLSVLGFIYSDALSIPRYANPFMMYILMTVFLFNPTKTFRHEARFWTIRVITRVVLAPFFFVTFADFWLADQLNSIVPALLDLQYFFCFFVRLKDWTNATAEGELERERQRVINLITFFSLPEGEWCLNTGNSIRIIRPIVAMLPAWWRFAQCCRRYKDTKEAFPHLVNAVKYASSFLVVIFSAMAMSGTAESDTVDTVYNPWFYLWVVSLIVSSCYAYAWDIKMDWGLFDAKDGDNKFLREEIVYSSTVSWFYNF